jgi:WD40 repeat protein
VKAVKGALDRYTVKEYGAVKLFDVASGKKVAPFAELTTPVNAVAFSPDGRTLAAGSGDVWHGGQLRLLDVTGHKPPAVLERREHIRCLAFSPDGTLLAAGGWEEVKLWRVSPPRHIRSLRGLTSGVHSVAFTPDGKRLVSGSGDVSVGEIKVWDVATGKEVARLQGHERLVNSVALSPNGKRLITGSMDWSVRLWEMGSAKVTRTITGGRILHVNSVAFSPDGTTVAYDACSDVCLCNVRNGETTATLRGHRDVPLLQLSLAFSPDGKVLASGGQDGTIQLWDVASKKGVRRWSVVPKQ